MLLVIERLDMQADLRTSVSDLKLMGLLDRHMESMAACRPDQRQQHTPGIILSYQDRWTGPSKEPASPFFSPAPSSSNNSIPRKKRLRMIFPVVPVLLALEQALPGAECSNPKGHAALRAVAAERLCFPLGPVPSLFFENPSLLSST